MDYMLPCLLKQRILNVKCNLFLITWDHHCENQLFQSSWTQPCSQGRLDQRQALLGVPFHQSPQRVNVCVQIPSLLTVKLAMSFSALFAESVSRKPCHLLLIVLLLVSSQLVWWNFRENGIMFILTMEFPSFINF